MTLAIGFSWNCEKESFLFSFAEEAKEAEKDIDEIQIEGECAEEGETSGHPHIDITHEFLHYFLPSLINDDRALHYILFHNTSFFNIVLVR